MSSKRRGGAVAVQPAINEIREEIEWLKKQLGGLKFELNSERKEKEKAIFGRDKLLAFNKKLINELKLLKEEIQPGKKDLHCVKVSF